METATIGHELIDHADLLVRNWRVSQLKRVGIPAPQAEIHANCVDWHQVARLIDRGCPWWLALRIVS